LIEAAGATVMFLPPYSPPLATPPSVAWRGRSPAPPDLNPIELLFSKLKSLLARRRNEPPTLSGSGAENFSAASRRINAPTTSVTPVTLKHDRKMS
jgi:transposase